MRQLKITKQVTNRDTPSLDKYLQEIGKVELISPEDEVILARHIKSGDSDALAKLVDFGIGSIGCAHQLAQVGNGHSLFRGPSESAVRRT